MKVAIRYKAIYVYAEPASFSPHLVRLFPKSDHHVRVERMQFKTDESADIQYQNDLFGNEIANCIFPEKRDRLNFQIELDLELTEKNPFHFLLESHALRLPFEYLPHETSLLAPFLEHDKELVLPCPLTPKNSRPTVETLVNLNQWIFDHLTYERREEGLPWEPTETLATGRGACRDFAVLFVAILRKHGLAARLASGFLWESSDVAKKDLRSDSALHAWVETYLPGAGWIGLDPTNGVLCDHYRILTAVGLAPTDITPIKGMYYGHKKIDCQMTTELEIKPR